MPKPLSLRKLKAVMVMKELTVTALAQQSGMSKSMVSEVLNGRRNDVPRLRKLRALIDLAPTPEELTHA